MTHTIRRELADKEKALNMAGFGKWARSAIIPDRPRYKTMFTGSGHRSSGSVIDVSDAVGERIDELATQWINEQPDRQRAVRFFTDYYVFNKTESWVARDMKVTARTVYNWRQAVIEVIYSGLDVSTISA